MNLPSYGGKLKIMRHDRSWTLDIVRQKLGISEAMVSFFENDKQLPSPDMARKIALLYGYDVRRFVVETGSRVAQRSAARINNKYAAILK